MVGGIEIDKSICGEGIEYRLVIGIGKRDAFFAKILAHGKYGRFIHYVRALVVPIRAIELTCIVDTKKSVVAGFVEIDKTRSTFKRGTFCKIWLAILHTEVIEVLGGIEMLLEVRNEFVGSVAHNRVHVH